MSTFFHSAAGLLFILSVILAACESQPSLPPDQQPPVLDTSYVAVSPPFSGFSGPEDIHIGNDQLLYVADTRANRLVMLNRAGQELSARPMLHPIAIAQDTRLDLLIGGEVVTASGDTAGAFFRIHLVSQSPDSAHRLDVAPIDTVWVEAARPARRFPGITVFGNNEYLAVRTGPDNSSFVDPDARVLQFDANDNFIGPVVDLATRAGSGITDINKPTGIASFPSTRDFILVQSSEGVSYGAIWLEYPLDDPDFEGWVPKFDPSKPEDRAIDFVRPNRYVLPEAVTIDRARRDVFVADAELDSIFKFTSRGRLRSESFGYYRSGGQMRKPTGLAYFEKILYVADREAGQIFRFRLSTDVPR